VTAAATDEPLIVLQFFQRYSSILIDAGKLSAKLYDTTPAFESFDEQTFHTPAACDDWI